MSQSPRIKFILGGLLILAAVVYLIASSTQASAEYFLTIDELNAKGSSVVDKNVRVSGAIIGDSITYDPQTSLATTPKSRKRADWPRYCTKPSSTPNAPKWKSFTLVLSPISCATKPRPL
jgi:hypothetical protein